MLVTSCCAAGVHTAAARWPTPQLCTAHADLTTATVTVAGEIDYFTAAQLTELGHWTLTHTATDQPLTVCLRAVTFADSAIAAALDTLQLAAHATGRPLQLINVPRRVTRVLTLLDATHLLPATHPTAA